MSPSTFCQVVRSAGGDFFVLEKTGDVVSVPKKKANSL